MEGLISFGNTFLNRKVFITGVTGFKGSWLSLWLCKLGAKVLGYSLPPNTFPNHYSLLNFGNIPGFTESITGDVRDISLLNKTIKEFKPDIIFHLAAQALVSESYTKSIETLETNIIGTSNIFEICKTCDSVKVVINVTTDKCYKDKKSLQRYIEEDELGGHDIYSASKACSEIITDSYRASFFDIENYKKTHNVLLSSVRAGNVIGGGDWNRNRIIPDLVQAAYIDEETIIRSPYSIRPWQHVLDVLAGYLCLCQKLIEGRKEYSGAWNFGPEDILTVYQVAEQAKKYWDKINYISNNDAPSFHETDLLTLNSSKSWSKLGWKNVWTASESIEKTILWYKTYYTDGIILSENNIDEYNDKKYRGAYDESKKSKTEDT